jgi:hypothetical protein
MPPNGTMRRIKISDLFLTEKKIFQTEKHDTEPD